MKGSRLGALLILGLGPCPSTLAQGTPSIVEGWALGRSASQVRDARREPVAGTATVSGVVMTDERSPQELKRARVELSTEGVPPFSTFTDDRGRFTFNRVPAGRYTLTATKAGYVRTVYGAKRPDRPGTPMTIADGQVVANVALKIARGAVVSGTIRDELGQPAPGVTVRVMQYRIVNGERTLAPALTGANIESTDDLGMYRIYGLPPGEYVLSATPRLFGPADLRQMTAADIQSAQQAVQQQTANPNAIIAPRPAPMTVTYAAVFYPGTSNAANAVAIALAMGEERTGIDMNLQLVRTARIEGTVVTPNGVPPQTAQLFMVPRNAPSSGLPTMISFNRVAVGPDGKFTYTGVAPGQYTLSARIGGAGIEMMGPVQLARGPAPALEQGGSVDGRGRNANAPGALWAMADLSVDGENINGVVLNMQPGLSVAGRIVVDAAGVEAPQDLSRARISLTPAGSGGLMVGIGGTGGIVEASGRFTLPDVTPGKYRISAQLSTPEANWTLKSAVINGKESLDGPVEITPYDRSSEAVVTFTNRTQEVSGTLSDTTGRPAPDYTIVIFPADKPYWSSARRIQTTRPDTNGRFTIRNLPTGDYRIAALIDIAPGEQSDPAFLEQLVPASVKFSLADGEKKVQDIRIAGTP